MRKLFPNYGNSPRDKITWRLDSPDGPVTHRVSPNCWIVMQSEERDRDWGNWIDHYPIGVFFVESDAVAFLESLRGEVGEFIIAETVAPSPEQHHRSNGLWYEED